MIHITELCWIEIQEKVFFNLFSKLVIENFGGNEDYLFSSSWSPNGIVFATGSQDKKVRFYDIRSPKIPFKILPAKIASVRNLSFSPDGRFLFFAEAADFVHIFDVLSDYSRSQVIDIFGEIG